MKKINTVLLIDDDEPTNFIHKKIIQNCGLVSAIQVANSGLQALNMLDHHAGSTNDSSLPDLIFLDINMPAMDGWEFLAQYKKLTTAQNKNIIIVMLTTSLNPDDEVRAKQIKEVYAYKSKPLTGQMINEIANTYF